MFGIKNQPLLTQQRVPQLQQFPPQINTNFFEDGDPFLPQGLIFRPEFISSSSQLRPRKISAPKPEFNSPKKLAESKTIEKTDDDVDTKKDSNAINDKTLENDITVETDKSEPKADETETTNEIINEEDFNIFKDNLTMHDSDGKSMLV